MIRKSSQGQHRVADGGVADSGVVAMHLGGSIPIPIPVTAPAGPFTVQHLNEHWFIGWPGAAQRIEDQPGLDSWLAANGGPDVAALDFGGDRDLEQRFWTRFGGGNATAR